MAKEKTEKLRFLCAKCRTRVTVGMKFAGKFIECPSCKQRTGVPTSQEEADDDARDLGVQQMYYQVGENCVKCGRKMKKGAVVCTKCGFDYKEGRQLTTEDLTVQEGEKRRGGPAMGFMVFEFVLLFGLLGAMVFRLLGEERIWWEQGLYLSGILYCLFAIPAHFMQWFSYRTLPIRDHALVKEENRAERDEASKPYGDNTILVLMACVFVGMGAMCFAFSRNAEGNFVIPFMSENKP
jgi:DNA-directed RNA polymerase subunit RPC12/RpoP